MSNLKTLEQMPQIISMEGNAVNVKELRQQAIRWYYNLNEDFFEDIMHLAYASGAQAFIKDFFNLDEGEIE